MNKKAKSLLYFAGFVIIALTHFYLKPDDTDEHNQLANSTITKGISIAAIH